MGKGLRAYRSPGCYVMLCYHLESRLRPTSLIKKNKKREATLESAQGTNTQLIRSTVNGQLKVENKQNALTVLGLRNASSSEPSTNPPCLEFEII